MVQEKLLDVVIPFHFGPTTRPAIGTSRSQDPRRKQANLIRATRSVREWARRITVCVVNKPSARIASSLQYLGVEVARLDCAPDALPLKSVDYAAQHALPDSIVHYTEDDQVLHMPASVLEDMKMVRGRKTYLAPHRKWPRSWWPEGKTQPERVRAHDGGFVSNIQPERDARIKLNGWYYMCYQRVYAFSAAWLCWAEDLKRLPFISPRPWKIEDSSFYLYQHLKCLKPTDFDYFYVVHHFQ